ncbi:hypothetical protein ACHAW5_009676 [Stephanodiscus triporus]|uniref:Uncharacterized protein n=1 Tax=Stephanodiscus triporus TaxID=2934178 RepID=A0ABD3NDT4_9STRA
MTRLTTIAIVALVGTASAFTGAPRTSSSARTTSTSFLSMSDPSKPPVERGVSMDQDGKSNVWAIEPRMEIENKSSEEGEGALGDIQLLRMRGEIRSHPRQGSKYEDAVEYHLAWVGIFLSGCVD